MCALLRITAAALALTAFAASGSRALAGEGKVVGAVRFEKIPFRDSKSGAIGLQFKNPTVVLAEDIKVQLMSEATGKEIAHTFTGKAGVFAIPWKVDKETKVWIRVPAESKHVEVRDNKQTVHAVNSDVFSIMNGEVKRDMLAKDSDKLAGAFNILECIRLADAFLKKADKDISLRRITVFWTPGHNPGTYFTRRNNHAFINGDRSKDSDEFDDHIIIHEYGHFIMSVFSRDDSPGGSHAFGDKLDPRLAWGEGWANFFACAVLNDPRYVDTGRDKNGKEVSLVSFNLDDNVRPGGVANYWNEHTVGAVLWDILDTSPARPKDYHVGSSFKNIWDVIKGPLEKRRHVSLLDFCGLFVEANPMLANQAKEMLAAHNIACNPAQKPPVVNSFHKPLQFAKDYEGSLNSLGHKYFNFDSVHFYAFTLDKKTKVKLHLQITKSDKPNSSDIDLWLHDTTGPIAISQATNGVGGTETITKELGPGIYYAEVKSYFIDEKTRSNVKNAGSYKLTATIEGGMDPAGMGREQPAVGPSATDAWQ